jgi:hypothetical protein
VRLAKRKNPACQQVSFSEASLILFKLEKLTSLGANAHEVDSSFTPAMFSDGITITSVIHSHIAIQLDHVLGRRTLGAVELELYHRGHQWPGYSGRTSIIMEES